MELSNWKTVVSHIIMKSEIKVYTFMNLTFNQ